MNTAAPFRALLRLGPGLLVALAAASCRRERPPSEVELARQAQAREQAERACDELGRRLLAELTAALQAGSTADALEVCAELAQPIAAEVRAQAEVRIGRISLRVRNPANAPDRFERTQLEEWEARLARGEPIEPHVELFHSADGTSELRYLRPIFLAELCTRCHGQPAELEPDVRSALARLYPEDQATRYAPGDLRGAFTARAPLRP